MKKPTHSPWGKIDQTEGIDDKGLIIRVHTPSHGGIGVHKSLEMPSSLASLAMEPAAEWRWFEEDCDWAAVPLAFPDRFNEAVLDQAKDCLRNWNPDAYEGFFGVKPTPEESHVAKDRYLKDLNKQNFMPKTGYGDWAWDVPKGFVYCQGARQSDEATKGFLVPADEYKNLQELVLNDYPAWEPDKSLPYTKPNKA